MTTFAVTSQDFRRITGHAGRCRRFLIYEAGSQMSPHVIEKLDLPTSYTIHEWGDDDGHPVFEVDVLLSGSAGNGFVGKLENRGIDVVLTTETDPESAIRAYMTGTLHRADSHHCLTQGIRRAVSNVLGSSALL